MAIEITSNKAGLATVLVTEGAEGMTLADLNAIMDDLQVYARIIGKEARNPNAGRVNLCNLYEHAKVVGELGVALRRYCHQRRYGGL